ncbi:ATP-binding cassette sub- A member 5 [Entophlyctis luteolus]|nr:ATP-binding cassette sub- A member 5 [Entophlyctis luteolus]
MSSTLSSLRLQALLMARQTFTVKRQSDLISTRLFTPIIYCVFLYVIRTNLNKIESFPADPSPSPAVPVTSLSFVELGYNSRLLVFAPNSSNFSLDVISLAASNLIGVSTMGFSDSPSLEFYQANNPGSVWAGVVFNTSADFADVQYTIRMNSSIAPSPSSDLVSPGQCRGSNDCDAITLFTSGFFHLQTALDAAIISQIGTSTAPNVTRSVREMPRESYAGNLAIAQSTAFVSILYLVLIFGYSVPPVIVAVVQEKETGMRDLLHMSGLHPIAYWLGYFIVDAILILPAAVAVTIVLSIGKLPGGSKTAVQLFFMCLLFGWSLTAFSYFASVFFKKSKVAAGVGVFFFLGFTLVSLIFVIWTPPIGASYVLGLFSPISFTLGLIAFGLTGDGVNFPDVSFGKTPGFILLAIDTALYLALAYLSEQFMAKHSDDGVLLRSMFRKPKQKDTEEVLSGTELIPIEDSSSREPVPDGPGLEIQGLRKKFHGDIVAVNSVSLKMRKGEIYGLLGHNGAGKTTLVNMLVGKLIPSGGSGTILGKDLVGDMISIRKSMGVCMQQNVLWEKLNVMSHLRFFGSLKGLTGNILTERIDSLLHELDLTEKANEVVSKLSGGQKRKLCLAIALIGDPDFLVLDEPTSGVDAHSRRTMWSLLQRDKAHRVTILTTHFMDEADILADRKAIISKGLVRCSGTSLFLKSKFGDGYHLTCAKEAGCEDDKVITFVQSFVGSANLSRSVAGELLVQLPQQSIGQFPKLFRALEDKKYELKLESYGVSMSTLEEVFLKLAKETTKDEASPNSDENDEFSAVEPLLGKEFHPNKKNTILKSLVYMRYRQKFSEPTFFFATIILPVLFGIAYAILVKYGNTDVISSQTPLDISLSSFPAEVTDSAVLVFNANQSDGFSSYLGSAVTTVQNVSINDYILAHPPLYIAIDVEKNSTRPWNAEIIVNDTMPYGGPVALNMLSNAILSASLGGGTSKRISVRAIAFATVQPSLGAAALGSIYLIGIGAQSAANTYGLNVMQEKVVKVKNHLLLNGVSRGMYWISIFLADATFYLLFVITILIGTASVAVPALSGPSFVVLVIGLIIFVPIALGVAYAWTFPFTTSPTYQTAAAFAYALSPLCLVLVTTIENNYSVDAGAITSYVLSAVYPMYSIMGLLYYLNEMYDTNLVLAELGVPDRYSVWELRSRLIPTLLIMVLDLIVVLALIWYVEFWRPSKTVRTPANWNPVERDWMENHRSRPEDDDVVSERQLVSQNFLKVPDGSGSGPNFLAAALEIRKVFKKELKERRGRLRWKRVKVIESEQDTEDRRASTEFVAVEDVSFGVRRGECFGLLGPNGAGKSTLMSILMADIPATFGRARVSDAIVTNGDSIADEKVGYCPQHDALWNHATVMEHLKLYALLRDVPETMVNSVAENIIKLLGLEEYKNVRAAKLSGGTKRKLSYALTAVGVAGMYVLDEPSTGMDPENRRKMWRVIQALTGKSGGILTTHSLEEAEALCTRIAIIVNGSFVCLGTNQHLKAKFGKGQYSLEVKCKPEAAQTICGAIEMAFGDKAVQKECYGGNLVYSLTVASGESQKYALADAFETLEKQKSQLGILEYSLSQVSLEQVFLDLTKAQTMSQAV